MADFKLDSSGKPRGRPKKFAGRSSGRGGDRRGSGRSGNRDSGRSNGRRDSGSRFGGRDSRRAEMTTVTCDACKERCEVPFKPISDKPIFCDKCFGKTSKSGKDNKDLGEINQKLDKIIKFLKIK